MIFAMFLYSYDARQPYFIFAVGGTTKYISILHVTDMTLLLRVNFLNFNIPDNCELQTLPISFNRELRRTAASVKFVIFQFAILW